MALLPPVLFNRLAGLFYSKNIKELIRSQIDARPGMRILDMPCGTAVLRSICEPCEYVGVDIDEERVTQAQAAGDAGEFLVADAGDLPVPAQSFDRILISGLFHHVNDDGMRRILAECARVLKKEGHLIIFEAIWPVCRCNLAGWLMRKMDEGKFVRQPREYAVLFSEYFNIASEQFPARLGLDYLLSVLSLKDRKG